METDFSWLEENYKKIKNNINDACAKCSRDPSEVTFMGVTKTVAPEIINASVDMGIDTLGENKVQEYLSKKDAYRKGVKMHFIGHLQTNKVKYIINDMVLIHSVASADLAEKIDKLAQKNGKVQDILIEVNIGDEPSKSGIATSDLDGLVEKVLTLENVNLRGFMAIPPAQNSEKYLARMQEIFENKKAELSGKCSIDTLSMGMSGDYESAVKYGATIVRIGTALYGARDYSKA